MAVTKLMILCRLVKMLPKSAMSYYFNSFLMPLVDQHVCVCFLSFGEGSFMTISQLVCGCCTKLQYTMLCLISICVFPFPLVEAH